MKAELSTESIEEFKKEAKIMAEHKSEFIVELVGITQKAKHYCIVMELMPKLSLHHFLKNDPNNSSITLLQIVNVSLDICQGLIVLHENKIVHRDLKSHNVLLDNNLRAKIGDFGSAKIKTETTTQMTVGKIGRTLNWSAPELFDEKTPTTFSSDIYALCMIFWELIIQPHKIPFEGLRIEQIVKAKETRGDNQETLPPENKRCPQEYADIIRSGWKKAELRPTAKTIAESLEKIS